MSGNCKSNKKRPPQLNKFMHPRNPYKNYTSFKELAIAYPEFRTFCTYDITGKVFLDFKNTQAVKSLTTCLLDRDFGLQVEIPDGRLVPTLPLRINYLLWIEDLLSLAHHKNLSAANNSVIGIDIGTGSACVYPLLGSKKFGWHFIATETDELNFKTANENITRNNLESEILLRKSPELFDVIKEGESSNFIQNVRKKKKIETPVENPLSFAKINLPPKHTLQNGASSSYSIDFTMCNPPFFSSEAEMEATHNSKKETRSLPSSVSTGSTQEQVTEGGEISFISQLIDKSLLYKSDVKIFTTLIGKKVDVKTVVRMIKEKASGGFVNVAETEFCQGRTMRWGVAWTFDSAIPLEKVVSKKQRLSQKPVVLYFPRSMMSLYTVQSVWACVLGWLKDIKIKPSLFKNKKHFVGATLRAYKPTWLHQRQKRRKKNAANEAAKIRDVPSEMESRQKRKHDNPEEETASPKKTKLQNSNQSGEASCDDVMSSGPVEDYVIDKSGGEDAAIDPAHDDSPVKSGLECILKCSLQLKLTGTLISLEMNYQSGVGKKNAMCQLMQYLENRMKNNRNSTQESPGKEVSDFIEVES